MRYKEVYATIAVVGLAVIGLIAFGNFLNDRLPTVHEPLVDDMREHLLTNALGNYRGTNWQELSNLIWQIMTTNAPETPGARVSPPR